MIHRIDVFSLSLVVISRSIPFTSYHKKYYDENQN